MTLTISQADNIGMESSEEAVLAAKTGDPRNISDDCMAIGQAIRSQRPDGSDRFGLSLTARQLDLTIAILDKSIFNCLRNDEADLADSFIQTRDTVLAQVAEHLPSRSRQQATKRRSLVLEDMPGYLLFQPGRRRRYSWAGSAPIPDDFGAPRISTFGRGRGVMVQVRADEVNLEVQVLPAAPELDRAPWESIAEITQHWTSLLYPELVLAVPGQEGTVLWDLTTDVWPHVTFRMRLSLNASGHAGEDHLLQMWPDHTTPPTVHKAAHKPDR
ncbi:hypothetical protein [Actinomadura sp. 7K507]|uniref:hypothetical protein n=1 Tax=Actinomadura sp. 7K507 TaxID=2530365 RepID=UPI0010468618|nr:hypothetical protein [Actinomadura sp. 7K507]TDC97722.1 hypothetical protein E1285_02545 [Actinomadura sp. 7K507]